MQAVCPRCGARYDVEDAKVPPEGRHARCRCGNRFLVRPPAPAKKPRPKHASPAAIGQTLYERLHRRVSSYYLAKTRDERFYVSSFIFAYREIPNARFIKEEVLRLRGIVTDAREVLDQAAGNREAEAGLREEIARHEALVKLFIDIAGISSEFVGKGMKVTYNQVLAVLRDVETAHFR